MSSNNQNNNRNNNTNFAGAFANQFQDFYKYFNVNQNNNFDLQRLTALQQRTIDSFNEANKALFDGFQKLAKAQSEFIQEQAQVAANVASKSLSAKTPEESIDNHTRAAQHYFDRSLENAQHAAKVVSNATVNAFETINKQAVENLSEFSRNAKKAS